MIIPLLARLLPRHPVLRAIVLVVIGALFVAICFSVVFPGVTRFWGEDSNVIGASWSERP